MLRALSRLLPGIVVVHEKEVAKRGRSSYVYKFKFKFKLILIITLAAPLLHASGLFVSLLPELFTFARAVSTRVFCAGSGVPSSATEF